MTPSHRGIVWESKLKVRCLLFCGSTDAWSVKRRRREDLTVESKIDKGFSKWGRGKPWCEEKPPLALPSPLWASMSSHVKLFYSCGGRHLWSEAGKEDHIDQVCLCWATTELKTSNVQWMTASWVNATAQVATAVRFLLSETQKFFFFFSRHKIGFNIQAAYCVWFMYTAERTGGNWVLWTSFWEIISFYHLSFYFRFELRGKRTWSRGLQVNPGSLQWAGRVTTFAVVTAQAEPSEAQLDMCVMAKISPV